MNPRTLRITYFDGTNEHELARSEEAPEGWFFKDLPLLLPELQALLDERALHTLFVMGVGINALQTVHRQRPMPLHSGEVQAAAYMGCDPGTVIYITHEGEYVNSVQAYDYGAVVIPVQAGARWMTLCDLTHHARLHTKDPVPPTLEQLVVELDRCKKTVVAGYQLAWAMGLETPTTGRMREIAEKMRAMGWESFKARTGTHYRRTQVV